MTIQIPQETLDAWEARDARLRASGGTEEEIAAWHEIVKAAELERLNKPKDHWLLALDL